MFLHISRTWNAVQCAVHGGCEDATMNVFQFFGFVLELLGKEVRTRLAYDLKTWKEFRQKNIEDQIAFGLLKLGLLSGMIFSGLVTEYWLLR